MIKKKLKNKEANKEENNEIKNEINNRKNNSSGNNNNKFVSSIKGYFEFYKTNVRRKNLVIFIIATIIFFISFNMFMNSIDTKSIMEQLSNNPVAYNMPNPFKIILKEVLPFTFLVILAGITPFCYLPVLGLVMPYFYSQDIANVFAATSHSGNLIFMVVGVIIKIIGLSLAISVGMHYTSISTKRFRYSQSKGYNLNNMKKEIYEMTNNSKKANELDKKMKDKAEKMEKLNVKVPYLYLIISFIISVIIMSIGTLITAI